jgi:hypothetical protein
VDEDEESLSEKFSKLNINITNEQHFKVPDFIKQNGYFRNKFSLMSCYRKCSFSGTKKENSTYSQSLGFMSFMKPIVEKNICIGMENSI